MESSGQMPADEIGSRPPVTLTQHRRGVGVTVSVVQQ